MKNKILLLILLAISIFGIAILPTKAIGFNKNAYAHTTHVTFKVSDVKKEDVKLQMDSYEFALKERIGQNIESYGKKDINEMCICEFHPFVQMLHVSFSNHYPIVISPDMMWLLICQGFASHVNLHSDSLRYRIVSHKGKMKISVRQDNFRKNMQNPWDTTFPIFCDSIKKYIGKDLNNLIVANFSTTGFAEKASYEVTLMDAVKKYFDYDFVTMCGIPEITILGKTSDWQWIVDNVSKFDKFGLSWWTKEMIPILKQFRNASENKIDKNFWQSIYKVNDNSGGPYISGWIVKFFPYVLDYEHNMVKNRFLDKEPTDEFRGLGLPNFPSGYSKVDFVWDYQIENKSFNMEFIAGFVGLIKDKNGNLKAEINWAVREKK